MGNPELGYPVPGTALTLCKARIKPVAQRLYIQKHRREGRGGNRNGGGKGKQGESESAHIAAVTTQRSLAAAKRFVGFSAKPHFGQQLEGRE